jgi:hypothetical protein
MSSSKTDCTLLRMLKGEISISYCDKQVDWSSESSPMSIDRYSPRSYENYSSYNRNNNNCYSSMSRVTPNIGGILNYSY